MSIDLHGHRALITGSTQGVGRAIALACAQAGADVILHGLQIDDSARRTRDECAAYGVRVEVIEGDLSGPTEDAIQNVYRRAHEHLPSIDLLVNNAGTYADVPFLEMSYESFSRTMRLNVFSYFFLTQAFARDWVSGASPGEF